MTDENTNPAQTTAAKGRTTPRKPRKVGAAAIGSAMSYPPDLRLVAPAGDAPEEGAQARERVARKSSAIPQTGDGETDGSTQTGGKQPSKTTKTQFALKALRRKRGVSLAELQEITGWQAHSVRGFLSGTVKKKLGLQLVGEVGKDGVRRYRIEAGARAG